MLLKTHISQRGYKAVQQNEEAELNLLCICLLRARLLIACALLKFGLGMGRLHILTTGIIGKLAGLHYQSADMFALIDLGCSSMNLIEAHLRTCVIDFCFNK